MFVCNFLCGFMSRVKRNTADEGEGTAFVASLITDAKVVEIRCRPFFRFFLRLESPRTIIFV